MRCGASPVCSKHIFTIDAAWLHLKKSYIYMQQVTPMVHNTQRLLASRGIVLFSCTTALWKKLIFSLTVLAKMILYLLPVSRDGKPVITEVYMTGAGSRKKAKNCLALKGRQSKDYVRSQNSSTLSAESEQSSIIHIDLEKPTNGGLGFALVGGDNGTAVLVKAISSNSVAGLDGRLKVCDQLLQVNGEDLSGLSHEQVVEILRRAQGVVMLTISRKPPVHLDSRHCTMKTSKNKLLYPEIQCQQRNSQGLEDETPRGCPGDSSENNGVHPSEEQNRQDNFQHSDDCIANCSRRHSGGEFCVSTYEEQCGDKEESCDSECWTSDEELPLSSCRVPAPPTGKPIVSEVELMSLSLWKGTVGSKYSGERLEAIIANLQQQVKLQQPLKEFMMLRHLKPVDDCTVGKAPENRGKNRYRDILPYDKTRVPIGDHGYINASYIRMPIGNEEYWYIACQGPLPGTTSDFWQMIWENKADVIAMMTHQHELGKVKCHGYWPDKMYKPMRVNRYLLRLESHQELDYFEINIIKMAEIETGEIHYVKHLKFISWPDHGVPSSSEQLVRFILYMSNVHHRGPLVIHCSAGIGRSGVLICTHVLLSLINKELSFNIMDVVREMRRQRHGMVQTKDQYLFCYKIVLEILLNILQLNQHEEVL